MGRQRKHNEDHLLIRAELGLFVVADGMGGHNAGDVASKLTTTSLGNFFEATETGELPTEYTNDLGTDDPAARRLAAAIRKANRDVFVISTTHSQHHGMGSTVVAVHVARDKIHVAHVGDSRCYRVRDGKIQQLTRDHSLINDALDLKPDLTPEELARLPKNIITRALGMKDQVKVDLRTESTRVGDVYLLCSDGLSGMVKDEEILDVLATVEEPNDAAEVLVAQANEAGGTDNISALIIRIVEGAREPEPVVDPKDLAPLALPAAAVDVLAKGGEVELDVGGAWTAKAITIQRCAKCRHELFPGNVFCVECGARIEA